MSNWDKNIAVNLRRIRKYRNMSLDMVSEATGVSKSMLGQIERGASNPTVTTIGKIATGLRLSFEDLLAAPRHEVSVIFREGIRDQSASNEEYRDYLFFPYDQKRPFEGHVIEVNSQGSYVINADKEEIALDITVFGGQLSIAANGQEYLVSKGDAVSLSGNSTTVLKNNSSEKLVMNIISIAAGRL